YSNFSINSVSFEHCCHPKFGDEIIAFKDDNTAIIHHKMCDKAYNKILADEKTVFCQWVQDVHYQYKMVISLPNTRGELAKLLTYMAKYEISIVAIDFGRQRHSYRQYCTIEFEINKSNIEEVKKILEKRIKIIDFASKKDAYQK
ncbi:MAG: bifunctional (p)ppGpp synthase/hydrolase, partial [Arcobacter sp.]